MSDYSYPNKGPRLVSYERHGSRSTEFNNRLSGAHESSNRMLSPEHRTQRSFSFQKKDDALVNQGRCTTCNNCFIAENESTSSGEEDDPELRELEERDKIVMKYKQVR
ncbi:unnamed protein product [Angiostrongylus costaricensis]|uniref:Uncharacterized protein n=1 Tax=Angiostrongylus costaricensis TaxID=334426 RepID=A0A158PL05_ANGCS|nr:unnamed protein product [Angiostrongylus costaricensis]